MKLKCYVSTDKLGSEVQFTLEFDEDEFEDMDENEKEIYIQEAVFEAVCNHINWNYEEVE